MVDILRDNRQQHAKVGRFVLAAQRREVLLSRLSSDGRIVVKELASELGIADDNLRRDLRELAAAGLCQRVYRGALPVSPAIVNYAARTEVSTASKRRVAARAATLITPGSAVILDGGTTHARGRDAALPEEASRRRSSPTARRWPRARRPPRVELYLIGGRLQALRRGLRCAAVEAAQGGQR